MPFKKVGKDDYYAHGNSFPGQEAKVKSSGPKTASYAKGGEVLHKSNSIFLKTPDRFRESQYKAKTEVPAPAAKQKSLPAVKPRG